MWKIWAGFAAFAVLTAFMIYRSLGDVRSCLEEGEDRFSPKKKWKPSTVMAVSLLIFTLLLGSLLIVLQLFDADIW